MSFTFEALPNQEAIDYFRAKGYAPAINRFSWRDVWADEHDRMFTVAKAMSDDVLGTIRAELDSAIADGRTFEDFRKAIEPKLVELGWWGTSSEIDPRTGRAEDVQLGSPRRLRIIYDTNLRTANAAGRWRRAQRNKALMPYFTYIQIDRPSKREAHKPFHGVTLPVDHPFWHTHWPPNGWQCGCIVRQMSRRTLEREGLTLTDEDTVARIAETEPYRDKRNGVTRQIPKGIDPSFERNAGMARFEPGSGSDAPDPAPAALPVRSTGTGPGARAISQAFGNAPDHLRGALAAMPALDQFTRARQGAVFIRSQRGGTIARRIDMDKIDPKSESYGIVLRHEYGHAVDYEAGGLRRAASAGSLDVLAADGDALVGSVRDRGFERAVAARQKGIDGAGNLDTYLAEALRAYGVEMDDLRAALGEAATRQSIFDVLAALDARDPEILMREGGVFRHPREITPLALLQDFVGAVTNNRLRYPFGHSSEYYAARGAQGGQPGAGNGAEAFANWFALQADPNPVYRAIAARLAPGLEEAYLELVADFGAGGR